MKTPTHETEVGLQQIIKEQCERNRERFWDSVAEVNPKDITSDSIYLVSDDNLKDFEQQTAEAVLSAFKGEAEAREKQLRDIHTMELDTICCMSIEDFARRR